MSVDTSSEAVERLLKEVTVEASYEQTARALGDEELVDYCADMSRVATTLRDLAAERDALREALQRIAEHADMRAELYTSIEDAAAGLGDIARAALKGGAP